MASKPSALAVCCLLISFFVSNSIISSAHTIRYVRPDGTGDGSSWVNATNNLQEAINNSGPSGQVWVAAGMYKPGGNANTNRTVSFSLKSEVAVYGGFVGNETALNQRPAIRPALNQPSSSTLSADIGIANDNSDNSYHVVSNPPGTYDSAVLDGFVLADGNANGSSDGAYGGGMYNNGANGNGLCSPTIRNCSFVNNRASWFGGGMYNYGDGGISSPNITNCVFIGNIGRSGGAIYNNGFFGGNSTPYIASCLFQDNTASEYGGAIFFMQPKNLIQINCSFISNRAYSGGAMHIAHNASVTTDRFTTTNCSFRGNRATANLFQRGDAIAYSSAFNYGRLFNCLFFDNNGSLTIGSDAQPVTATNCLFDASSSSFNGTGNQISTASPFSNSSSAALSGCTLAINGGTIDAPGLSEITTDLAGTPRIRQGQVDIGAYEGDNALQITASPSLTIGWGSQVTLTASGATSYTWSTGSTTASISPAPLVNTTYSVTGMSGSCIGRISQAISVSCGSRVFVTQTGAGLRNGSNWANAYAGTSLQAAIDFAGRCGSQVWVAAGLYRPTTTTSRTASFSMVNGVTIYGGFVGTETTLTQRPNVNPLTGQPSSSTMSGDIGTLNSQTDNSYHIIKNRKGTLPSAILDGFCLTGGYANGGADDSNGAAIFNDGVTDGTVCSPTIRFCLFAANRATFFGAALYNDARGNGHTTPAVSNCLFQNNIADQAGGAIFNNGGFGVFSGFAMPALTNCAFVSNSATVATSDGGAMFTRTKGILPHRITNCLFLQNSAGRYGGALHYEADGTGPLNIQLTNCTFRGNTATTNGGAMSSLPFTAADPITTELVNCVEFDNGGAKTFYNYFVASSVGTYSLFSQASVPATGMNTSGPGNLTTTVSPFASLTSATLLPCSAAINAGTTSTTILSDILTDLVGNARVVGNQIDMGAYESSQISRSMISTRAGNWTDPASWSCNRLPNASDVVTLRHSITLPASFISQVTQLQHELGGVLRYEPNAWLKIQQ